jgi:hypothetical protein
MIAFAPQLQAAAAGGKRRLIRSRPTSSRLHTSTFGESVFRRVVSQNQDLSSAVEGGEIEGVGAAMFERQRLFREVNNRIAQVSGDERLESLVFLCECGDEG